MTTQYILGVYYVVDKANALITINKDRDTAINQAIIKAFAFTAKKRKCEIVAVYEAENLTINHARVFCARLTASNKLFGIVKYA
jgi:hypothetical protein